MPRNLYKAYRFTGLHTGNDKPKEVKDPLPKQVIIATPEEAYRHFHREMLGVYRSKFNVYLLPETEQAALKRMVRKVKLGSRDLIVVILHLHHMLKFAAEPANLPQDQARAMLSSHPQYLQGLVAHILVFNRNRDEAAKKAAFLDLCKNLSRNFTSGTPAQKTKGNGSNVEWYEKSSSKSPEETPQQLQLIREELMTYLEPQSDAAAMAVKNLLKTLDRREFRKILCKDHQSQVRRYQKMSIGGKPSRGMLDDFFSALLFHIVDEHSKKGEGDKK